jgi:hypothetical protein
VGAPYGRVLAGAYLLSLPVLAAGLVGLAVADADWAAALAIIGGPALVILACVLAKANAPRGSGYRIEWYRLALGIEAPRAWRVLIGRGVPLVDSRYRR